MKLWPFVWTYVFVLSGSAWGQACPPGDFQVNGQFAPYSPPDDFEFDQTTGEFVNLETQLIKPILVADTLDLVFAINEPDQRVEVLDRDLNLIKSVVVGQGPTAMALNPSAPELWVSVRHQSSIVVINTNSLEVTDVLRAGISYQDVGAGAAAFPGGIAFANAKAYVASTFTDSLLTFDATSKACVGQIPLTRTFNGTTAALNDPYNVVAFSGVIFVTSLLSGNNSAARSQEGQVFEKSDTIKLGPDDVEALDLATVPGVSLPDYDIAVVSPASDSVVRMLSGIGSVILGATGNPGTQDLIVSNLQSFNARQGASGNTKPGESSFPDGRVVENRFTLISTLNGSRSTIATELLGAGAANIVMPTDIAVDDGGDWYVAGYSSSNIGVWSANGAFQGTIDTPAGPRGLAYSAALDRLYSLNRAENNVTAYDIGQGVPSSPVGTYTMHDPTYDNVKSGRKLFLEPNSALGTTNCASCHIDGRKDGLGWDLSKTLEAEVCDPPDEWRDRKGVMVTQDLRGLAGTAPYHWRGEQEILEDFSATFEDLLHGTEPSEAEFQQIKAFILSLNYPPNPFQQMNRVFSPQTLDDNDQVAYFHGTGTTCAFCHIMPHGTNADLTENLIGDSLEDSNGVDIPGHTNIMVKAMKTAPLRALWTKKSAVIDADSTGAVENMPMTGFGFHHGGVPDSIDDFLDIFFGILDQVGVHDSVLAFVDEMDTGLAPATMFSEILNASTAGTDKQSAIRNYLIPQAGMAVRNCDIAVKGQMDFGSGMVDIGLVYDPALNQFLADDGQSFFFGQLAGMASNGDASLLFLGQPVGSGSRIGVDRDRDGVFDGLEAAMNTDATNPDSDGDGMWDGFDPDPDMDNGNVSTTIPTLVGPIEVVFATTNSIKLTYETTELSPTIVEFGETPALGRTVGDGFQSVLPSTSNLWKRHHSVILEPVLDNSLLPNNPIVPMIPVARYHFRVVTQGQNGLTWTSSTEQAFTKPNQSSATPRDSFRVSELQFNPPPVNNNDGTFTYTVEATFEVTQLNPVVNGLEIPGRFTIYDDQGDFVFVNDSAIVANSKAIFTYTTGNEAHEVGDRVTFDIPMWLSIDGLSAIKFPGDWSDGPSFVETTAPN